MVKVGGQLMPGWIDWEIDNNTFYQADTFRVRFAMSLMPAGYGAAWWATQGTMMVEVFAGFPADPANFTVSDLDSLLYGQVDDITFDPVAGIVEVAGRDLTAGLIDTKTTEKWPNQTSAQIATTLAQRHGLTPVVTATTQKTGKYYEIDHIRMTDQRSEWDLLTWLAHQEQFVVYVKGQTLHFEPQPTTSQTPYVLQWAPPTADSAAPSFNGTAITFARNLTLAKDVIVKVRSWNAKNKKGFTKTAQATHNKNTVLAGAAQPTGEAQTYSYVVPGLTPDEALRWAQAKLVEITAHEVRVTATLPADNLLGVTDIIKVLGTGTAFDQTYYPDSITRSMSIEGGYMMTVNAKNHSPESTVAA
jgi:phage protein D